MKTMMPCLKRKQKEKPDEKKKKRRGCFFWCCGCCLILVVLLAILIPVVVVFTRRDDKTQTTPVTTQPGGGSSFNLLTVSNLLASFHDVPDSIELNIQGVKACTRIGLTKDVAMKVLKESAEEVASLRAALGA